MVCADDTVLFLLAALFPDDTGGAQQDGAKGPADVALDLVAIPLGWVYLAIPALWFRRKFQAADIPSLQQRQRQQPAAAAAASGPPEMSNGPAGTT